MESRTLDPGLRLIQQADLNNKIVLLRVDHNVVKKGKIKENEMFKPCDSKSGLGNYTPEELRDKLQFAFKSYYFNPKYLISQFLRSLFVYGNFRVFTAGLKLIVEQRENTILARR